MSEIRVTNIIGETGVDAVNFTKGINATGIVTATSFAGSGANLTGIESGLTVAQQWRITSNKSVTTSQSFITANWEAVDTDGYGAINSMSESSGVFTFPVTGIYLIRFIGAHESTATINYSQTEIHTTTDNGTYGPASYGYASMTSGSQFSQSVTEFIFDVTNTSTHKVKFGCVGSNNESRLNTAGGTNANQTYATFIRLGAT